MGPTSPAVTRRRRSGPDFWIEARCSRATIGLCHGAGDQLLDRRVAADFDQAAAAVIDLLGQFEHFARGAVDQHHLAVGVGDHDALGHAAQNRFEFFALLGQGLDVAHHRVGGGDQALLGQPHQIIAADQTQRMALGFELFGGASRLSRRSISTRTTIAEATIPPANPTPSTTASRAKETAPLAAKTASSIGGRQDAEQHRNHQAANDCSTQAPPG